MLKIIHTGDFHIGAGFSSFNTAQAINAENMQFLAISSMINYANVNNVDIILIAGDTFDNHVVDFKMREKLFLILEKFNGEIFIVCGNHDYYFKGSFWDHTVLPANTLLIKSNQLQTISRDSFNLHAASFTNIYEKIDFSNILYDEEKINIGLVHADILTDSQYNPMKKNDIRDTNLDYLAVGHNHKFSEVLKVYNTFFACPGNISSTGFDETSKKGFIVLTFNDDNISYKFISSGGLEILNLQLDMSIFYDINEVFCKLQAMSCTNILLNLTLTGIDNFGIDVEYMQKILSEYFFDIRIENSTDMPENLWRYIDDDNLLGEFSRILRVCYDNQENKHEILNALKLGIDSLIF